MSNRRKLLHVPYAVVFDVALASSVQRRAKKRDRVSPKNDSTRRHLLVALTAAASALAARPVSFAQAPAKVWRIGVLHPGRKGPRYRNYTAFFEALRDLGYAEGNNISVQWQFADYNLQHLPELAALLVKRRSI